MIAAGMQKAARSLEGQAYASAVTDLWARLGLFLFSYLIALCHHALLFSYGRD